MNGEPLSSDREHNGERMGFNRGQEWRRNQTDRKMEDVENMGPEEVPIQWNKERGSLRTSLRRSGMENLSLQTENTMEKGWDSTEGRNGEEIRQTERWKRLRIFRKDFTRSTVFCQI